MKHHSELRISVELLRELLDLPDGIRIAGFGGDFVAIPTPVPPHTLSVAIESDHELHADQITPVYRRHYDQGITRVELLEIDGYQGPIEPRPSTRRARS